MKKKYTFGFIGAGNMGGALLFAVAKKIGGETLAVCDRHPERLQKTTDAFGVTLLSAPETARNSKFIVLGVKPQVMKDALSEIASALAENPDAILVSMAAGLTVSDIEEMLGRSVPVIRIMPNTPCAVGEGLILYTANAAVADRDLAEFVSAFSEAGVLDEIEESKMDAASALAGCGPAFAYIFAEALADGAVRCGLPRAKAVAYAAKVLAGSGKMIAANGGHIGDLKDAVCSPGGTTIEGVSALEQGGVRSAAIAAVTAAYLKSARLRPGK